MHKAGHAKERHDAAADLEKGGRGDDDDADGVVDVKAFDKPDNLHVAHNLGKRRGLSRRGGGKERGQSGHETL